VRWPLLILLLLYSAGPAGACLICEDVSSAAEEKLAEWVAETGAAAVPQLREILLCRENRDLRSKVVAARELGRLGDAGSADLLEGVVLEILNPDSAYEFGISTPAHALRFQAARSLVSLRSATNGERLWAERSALSHRRQEELPALLYALRTPELEEKLVELLDSPFRATVFQAIVELRRSGGRRAAAAVERTVSLWKRELEEGSAGDIRAPDLRKMIRYGEGTIRVLRGREVRGATAGGLPGGASPAAGDRSPSPPSGPPPPPSPFGN